MLDSGSCPRMRVGDGRAWRAPETGSQPAGRGAVPAAYMARRSATQGAARLAIGEFGRRYTALAVRPPADCDLARCGRRAYITSNGRVFVKTLQKTAHKAAATSEPVAITAVAVPKEGEEFSDKELHARFGVPMQGGIRVSRENRCIVLVGAVDDSPGRTGAGPSATIVHMGQDADRRGVQNQEMSDVNLALSRSSEEGYTVLHFTKGRNAMTFNSRVEYDSHEFEFEFEAGGGRRPRVVIKFNLRKVGEGAPAQQKVADAVEATKELKSATAQHVGGGQARIEATDSPPLTPEEVADIEDFLAGPEPSTISKEEFLGIVMDDKKLREHVRSLDS